MSKQLSPLAQVKRISSVLHARAYLDKSQSELGALLGCDQATISRVERGKICYTKTQIEKLAIAVALKFRIDSRHNDWGLQPFYNSPLTFEARGICYRHGKRGIEYPLVTMKTKCPKCQRPD